MIRKLLFTLALISLPLIAQAQLSDDGLPVKAVFDETMFSGDAVMAETWHSDTIYLLTENVYVDSGQTLTIEPGTIIKGEPNETDNPSALDDDGFAAEETGALIVARGGKILAQGTAELPIIFTSDQDDLDDAFDLPMCDDAGRGLWGGIVLLGYARINTATGVGQIEGIDELEPRGQYGGNDDDDSSGVLTYVSVRHGGDVLSADNEINGITFGGIGRKTVVSHCEVLMNLDDGFEFFGGTVNVDHLIAAFGGDDGMDYDEGYRGCNLFPFVVGCQGMDNGGEHDGGTTPEDGEPFGTVLNVNATYIGAGKGSGQKVFADRDNFSGAYYNSFFYDHGTYGIDIENLPEPQADSRDRLIEGNLLFRNSYWWKMGNGNTVPFVCNNDDTVKKYVFDDVSLNNHVMEVHVRNVSRIQDQQLDPRICNDTLPWVDPSGINGYVPHNPPGYPDAIDVVWPAMTPVDYVGAFDPDLPMASQWTAGWTFLDWGEYLGDFGTCTCCRNRGNVDGIIGFGGPIDVADLTYLVSYLFQGGSPADCTEESNVDAISGFGGPVDVADLTYLVAYLFQAGDDPPACP